MAEAIADVVPYDGPHDMWTVRAAADGVSQLVRYLNNATGPWNAKHTLEYAATTDSIVGSIKAAAYGLDQLLGQLRDGMVEQANRSDLYDASATRRDDTEAAQSVATELAARINDARAAASGLAHALEAAHSMSARLGNRTDD
jgi:hypothetical protein